MFLQGHASRQVKLQASPSDHTWAIKLFHGFARNGDGAIDRASLASRLRSIDRSKWDDARVDKLMEIMDNRHCRCVSQDGFVCFVLGQRWAKERAEFLNTMGPGCSQSKASMLGGENTLSGSLLSLAVSGAKLTLPDCRPLHRSRSESGILSLPCLCKGGGQLMGMEDADLPPSRHSDGTSTRASSTSASSRRMMSFDSTPNLFCNWSAVCGGKIQALIQALHLVLPKGKDQGFFFDLGCGDGRVVLQVCAAFPNLRGVGVDLNRLLVEGASARAKALNLHDRCEFRTEDFVNVDLSMASAVFMFLPKTATSHIVQKVFAKSGLQVGATVFSADGKLTLKGRCRPVVLKSYPEKEGLFSYVWKAQDGTSDASFKSSSTPIL